MKKRNLNFVLSIILFALLLVFIFTTVSKNKEFISGLASPAPGEGEECTECSGGISVDQCDPDDMPNYCVYIENSGCSFEPNCQICGCPENRPICSSSGVCEPESSYSPSNGNEGSSCSDHSDCGYPGVQKVCINGKCKVSTDGDGVCAYELSGSWRETCENNFFDCEGKKANCLGSDICQEDPIFPGTGQCTPLGENVFCEDGTPVGECSIIEANYGKVCQQEPDGTINLVSACESCGTIFESSYTQCPETYSCQSGECILDTSAEDYEEIKEEIENKCEYVGGTCARICPINYYELTIEDNKEYGSLISDCQKERSSYKCCYPYEKDDVNDCEYAGGTCLNICEGDYYSPEIPFLDDECSSFTGRSSCCLEYIKSTQKSPEEDAEFDREVGNFLDILFGITEEEKTSEDGTIRLGEYVSLNRDIIFVMLILTLIIIIAVYGIYHKNHTRRLTKKTKKSRRKR